MGNEELIAEADDFYFAPGLRTKAEAVKQAEWGKDLARRLADALEAALANSPQRPEQPDACQGSGQSVSTPTEGAAAGVPPHEPWQIAYYKWVVTSPWASSKEDFRAGYLAASRPIPTVEARNE